MGVKLGLARKPVLGIEGAGEDGVETIGGRFGSIWKFYHKHFGAATEIKAERMHKNDVYQTGFPVYMLKRKDNNVENVNENNNAMSMSTGFTALL